MADRSLRWTRLVSAVVGLALLSTACFGYRRVNERLDQVRPDAGYRPVNAAAFRDQGDITLYLAFSGGGTRAAALAYGVLETLRDTRFTAADGEARRLLDEVDTLSGVSGGSFPAAYYAISGDRIFDEFEDRFLRRNIQAGIIWRALWPWNTIALMTPWMSRSDIAKGIYHGSVFDEATFADLEAAQGPRVYVNATDLSSGERFVFTQAYFDAICSDLGGFPIAYAVAASSAVPALLSPVSLKSWAGTCGYTLPTPLVEALGERESRPRRHRVAEGFAQFADPARRYAHLIDGGISDNLGLRAGIDMVSATGGLDAAARLMHQEVPRHVVVLSVNAETAPPSKFDLSSAAPGFAAMMAAVSGSQIRRYNFETLLLARESLERWVSEARGAGIDVEGHLIEVSFDNIRDPERRSRLKNLPTSFSLSDEEVDALRAAARELLLQSPDFQRLVAALEAG